MAIELDKIYWAWLREIKRFLNSKSRIIGSLGMPLVFLLAFGVGIGSLLGSSSYKVFIVPGIIGMTLLTNSISSGVSIIWDREFGFLKEMLVAPTSRTNIVIGRMFGGATTAVFQGLIIMVIGILLFGMAFTGVSNFLIAILVMLLMSSSFVALGIALASIIQEIETFQLVMNFLIMPLTFLSNAVFPLNQMPVWLQYVAYLNPLTYGVDALRGLLIGTSTISVTMDAAVLIIIPTVFILMATYLFDRTSI